MTTERPDLVYDVGIDTFEAGVIEASRERPVVVDFWAPWCAPCRSLGPILERVVLAQDGRAALARVNVDEHPQLAAAFGVRGIPAVKVFRDGRVAAQFTGALPQAEVERVLASVVPSAGDETAAEAARLLAEGKGHEAERRFRAVLETDPRHPAALIGLAAIALEKGDEAQARQLAAAVEPGTPNHEQAVAILARLDFLEHCRIAGGREAAARRLKAAPDDLDARYDLAVCLAAQQDYQAALDQLLAIVERDRHFKNDLAKETMVRIFGIVGQRSELADDYRQRLAQVLY